MRSFYCVLYDDSRKLLKICDMVGMSSDKGAGNGANDHMIVWPKGYERK